MLTHSQQSLIRRRHPAYVLTFTKDGSVKTQNGMTLYTPQQLAALLRRTYAS